MNGSQLHQLLGAYLLGGLDSAEAAAFRQHLGSCLDCRKELDELAGVPALLDALPVPEAIALTAAAAGSRQGQAAAMPGPAAGRLLDELGTRRRALHRRWLAALAAAAAAGVILGALAGPVLNPPAAPDASYSVRAGNGLEVTVGLVRKAWGTELAQDGRSLPPEGTFSLWVKDRDGREDRACSWAATTSGRVRITGATPLQLASIGSVEMRDSQQQTVAVIAVPHHR